ncbi:zinc finger, LSD1-type, Caspase-like domain protein [Artemisia annua]|uniref:Zinc finger, LSD1-type, Caspase-like domain protein n=1 Tax=Artemisia annua TaxID=35608 RepID=A0A2U1Q867_ARTAN|nr:zinc finger, LSD1-type, Caspase-like domain protein [Artemisia annua]
MAANSRPKPETPVPRYHITTTLKTFTTISSFYSRTLRLSTTCLPSQVSTSRHHHPHKTFQLHLHSGSFNYAQQQQQQVFPSLTASNSYSYGVPGRKKAVIVGVSYKNTRHELKGCINDAMFMKHLLMTKFWFTEDQIVMLTGYESRPTMS